MCLDFADEHLFLLDFKVGTVFVCERRDLDASIDKSLARFL
jgi:hypothetical protein